MIRAEVIVFLRPFVTEFDHEKDDATEDGDPHVNLVARELPHFQRGPRQDHRDGRGDENRGIECSHRNIEQAVRPVTRLGIEPEENVSGKKSAEEHDFRGEKKPDADLGVPKPGIGTSSNCVWNFHLSRFVRR